MPPETLIEFPCHFPIKVMGEVHDEFTSTVIEIIKQKKILCQILTLQQVLFNIICFKYLISIKIL